ncbi:alpha/beta hydrolase [Frigoribacterium sp. CG_9.8]|uniref:alpha/beta hydrolase n=1 Tax=Frigoribacterium sp. CG_9.8 TaxID=2787733 RepID=UPI0018CA1DAE|nr:alpha/beta hydrolase [Frigoribacterium sp. CG_9.8]MBG6107082.1 hypothetical protein [Frigoribacterium sp. CG_9.8]
MDPFTVLFDVAAVSSSGVFGGVAAAFGIHEISNQIAAMVVGIVPVTRGESVVGGLSSPYGSGAGILAYGGPQPSDVALASIYSAPSDPALLFRLSGSKTLDRLTVLSVSEVAAFVAGNPAAVSRLLVSPPRASSVAAWWAAIPSSAQKKLATAAPVVVGNLDGVPVAVRDRANRLTLTQAVTQLQASIDSGAGRAKLIEKRHHLNILTQVAKTLKHSSGEPDRQLLTLDPSGEVRAAIVVGNLATADYVSYLVPGMFFTVQGQMYDWTVIAQDLQVQHSEWLATLAGTDSTLAGKTAATVAWIGYQTPGALDIASLDRAESGANLLGHAIQGIRATRAESPPFVSLITHSYGSTAAMMELANGGMTVDALAIVGSPGSAVQSASDLAVKDGNVFVGEAAWDPVVNTAFYGSDPGVSAFGAHRMDVAAATDPITRQSLAAAVGHLGYFDIGTTAMRNFALIGLNQSALVSSR